MLPDDLNDPLSFPGGTELVSVNSRGEERDAKDEPVGPTALGRVVVCRREDVTSDGCAASGEGRDEAVVNIRDDSSRKSATSSVCLDPTSACRQRHHERL